MNAPTSLEYAAVRHILDAPTIRSRTAPHVGAGAIDWAGILAQTGTMSEGEQILVRAAHELWEADGAVRLAEIARGLDSRNITRVFQAIVMLRGESTGVEAIDRAA